MARLESTTPPGGWPSKISASDVARAGMSARGRMSSVTADDSAVYWRESIPASGRHQLFRLPHGSRTAIPLLPDGFSATSRVHEFGGGEYAVQGKLVVFANASDQRLYRLHPNAAPEPVTPAPETPQARRYADGQIHPNGRIMVVVEELHHHDASVVNRLVLVDLESIGAPQPIAEGRAFYAAPRFSPDGRQLSWLTWDPPQMPWDGTTLWLGAFDDRMQLAQVREVAGGSRESIFQPSWSPDGILHFASDRSGWWNIYSSDGRRQDPATNMAAEIGAPAWAFGLSSYAFLSGGRLAVIAIEQGFGCLWLTERDAKPEPISTPFTAFYPSYLASDGGDRLFFLASSPESVQALYHLDARRRSPERLHGAAEIMVDPKSLSRPESMAFSHPDGRQVHAFVYWPRSPDLSTHGLQVPLILDLHGGPTQHSVAQLSLETQFWTSRGFAVAAVNYAGSTGFGRAYREQLRGQWGVIDVEDCALVARSLVASGRVDPDRVVIRGSSAGGLTCMLAAAAGGFAAASCSYGLLDLQAISATDHKFEAHYLDSLVGTDPERLKARSPIHADWSRPTPILLLHGQEDPVVPVEQARLMAASLADLNHPHALIELAGEGHGFSSPAAVERALNAELSFFRQVLSISSDEALPDISLV